MLQVWFPSKLIFIGISIFRLHNKQWVTSLAPNKRSAVDFVGPSADVEVSVKVQVFGTFLQHQAVLGALVVFVAVVLVRVIIFWYVFGHLSGERHAIRCLLCQCHGDDNSETNWKNINWQNDLQTAFKLHTNREFPYRKSTSCCELYTSDLPLRLTR